MLGLLYELEALPCLRLRWVLSSFAFSTFSLPSWLSSVFICRECICALLYIGLHSLMECSRNRQEWHAPSVFLIRFCYLLAGSGLRQISYRTRRFLWFPIDLRLNALLIVERIRECPVHSRTFCSPTSPYFSVVAGCFHFSSCPCPVSYTVFDCLLHWCVSRIGGRVLRIHSWQNL